MKKISVCVCCFNEEENIELMYQAITKEMQAFPNYDYEILFEDNDSSDKSQAILREICAKDSHVRAIFNAVNFGPDRSSVNCMSSATGDAILCITCDFQDPPEMIPEFIKYWEEGYSIVWGQKTSSKESKIKRACREIYYSVIDKFSDHKQLRDCIGFGIMDRSVLEVLLPTIKQDPLVHVRHLVTEYGFNMKLLPYEQQERLRGKSSYNISRYFDFAIISLCNTSTKPLRMMTVMGIVTAVGSLLVGLFYLIYKLTHWYTFEAGQAPLVIGMFFFAAAQLFCIGILGEYVSILLRKTTERPIVVEKERLNFDEVEESDK